MVVSNKKAKPAAQSLLRCIPSKESPAGCTSFLDLELLETGDKIPNDFYNEHLQLSGQSQFSRDGHFEKIKHGVGCDGNICQGAMMNKSNGPIMADGIDTKPAEVWDEARGFIKQFYAEAATVPAMRRHLLTTIEVRLKDVRAQIKATGTYVQTFAELEFGARLAWRNEARCINRKVWDQLQLIDRREQSSPKEMFASLLEHVDAVWNGGALGVAISIFKPKLPGQRGCEFVSAQMYRFAAYPVEDGGVLGDPANLALTELCMKCGWKAPAVTERTPWDLLPMLIADEKGHIEVFELPERFKQPPYIVHLSHPDPRISEAVEVMGLRWCAIPVLTTFTLWCGGIVYQCCPFSGWFMQTEVARDLADVQRYNILPRMIDELGLPDRTSMYPIDTAWLELNRAVTHSFQEQRIALADHQSTTRSFCEWFKVESKRAPVPGDWVWMVPPLGGSTCPVFHQEMVNFRLSPLYMFNENRVAQALSSMPQPVKDFQITTEQAQADAAVARRRHMPNIQVLVGSQTGTCERLASNYVRAATKRGAHCACFTLAAFMDLETNQVVSSKVPGAHLPPPIEAVVAASPDDIDAMQERLSAVDVLYTKLLEMGTSQKVLLILCATTGQGQFPGNAHTFAQACQDLNFLAKKHSSVECMCRTLRNTGLQFAVCGFGSTSYLKFNQAAVDLHASLCELLGGSLVPLGACDAQKKQAQAWAEWYKNLDDLAFGEEADQPTRPCPKPAGIVRWTGEAAMPTMRTMSSSAGAKARPRSGSLASERRFSLSVVAQRRNSITRTGMAATLHMSPADDTDTRWDQQAVVTGTKHVVPPLASTTMVEVEFQVPVKVGYNPGDYVEVQPENPEAMAQELLVELGLESQLHHCFVCQDTGANLTDTLSDHGLEPTGRFPEGITLLQAFVRVLDISGPPPPGLLVYFAYAVRDPILDKLAEGLSEYADWVEQDKPLLIDIVRRYHISCTQGPCKVPLEAFLEELPQIKRRTYSISSRASQESTGRTKFTVTATVNTFHASLGARVGLCSGFLDSLSELDSATVRFREGKRLSLEGVTRLFLIGAGSGIGPLRAFWQEFLFRNADGRIILFQGCRSLSEQPYAEEIAALEEGGRLECHVACSNSMPKCYVQHALASYPGLWQALRDPGARFFVSGATRVAQSVRRVFLNLGQENGLRGEEAFAFVISLSDDHRYVEDVFGGPETTAATSKDEQPKLQVSRSISGSRLAPPLLSSCRYQRTVETV